ncbi:ABC transporter permease [Bosea sp. 2KB_26]|uniref:ABC transporter permease n=1 Tax=Bosea sp. 2KB_26 TaxID=3237475 RepID=UPI000DE3B6B0
MPKDTIIITAESQDGNYWRDLWRERELLAFLAWRDLLVRYKQTFVGIAWTVLKPLAVILVYTFVFGVLAQLPSHGVPYTLIVLTGLLPWQLFSTVMLVSSDSLLSNAHLVQKVYFPRIIIPVSSIVVCIVDHLVSFLIIFLMLAWFGVAPGWQFLLLPFVTFLAVCCALGLGLIAAALNVRYRDVRQLLPILLQIGVFVCPVGYATSLVSERWQWLYALNPVVGIIDAFRWCVLGKTELIFPPSILVSIVFAVVSLAVGVRVFRRAEPSFADAM